MVKKKLYKTSKKAITKGFTKARGRPPSAEEIAYYKSQHKKANINWKEKPKRKRRSSATKKDKLGKYRILYDHMIDTKSTKFPKNKKQAIETIRKDLIRFPHAKASLEVPKKDGKGWKAHSSYKWRYNRKTGKHRLVKL